MILVQMLIRLRLELLILLIQQRITGLQQDGAQILIAGGILLQILLLEEKELREIGLLVLMMAIGQVDILIIFSQGQEMIPPREIMKPLHQGILLYMIIQVLFQNTHFQFQVRIIKQVNWGQPYRVQRRMQQVRL